MHTRLSVVGNISHDTSHYSDGRRCDRLGGAALHTALAAARADAHAAPVSVIGHDLAGLPATHPQPGIDWSALAIAHGPSAAFTLTYGTDDTLTSSQADYGITEGLTRHALDHITANAGDFFHISLRRPLQPEPLLVELTNQRAGFSVDLFLPSAADMIRAATPWLHRAAVIFTNAAEYRLLAEALEPDTLPLVAITDGPRPARLLTHGQPLAAAQPPQVNPTDVTGAGDTFAGTFLAHWLASQDTARALDQAVHAAAEHLTAPPLLIPAPRRS